jgi:hypothetical protein
MTAFDTALLQDAIAERRCVTWRPGECPVGVDLACEIITAIAGRFDELRSERDCAYARGQLKQALWLLEQHERVAAQS